MPLWSKVELIEDVTLANQSNQIIPESLGKILPINLSDTIVKVSL